MIRDDTELLCVDEVNVSTLNDLFGISHRSVRGVFFLIVVFFIPPEGAHFRDMIECCLLGATGVAR